MDERQSLLGVELEADRAVVRTQHRDGSCDTSELQPQTDIRSSVCPGSEEHALCERLLRGLTREQHIQRSLRVEAALIKITDGQPQSEGRLQRLAWPALREVIKAMGWEDRALEGT